MRRRRYIYLLSLLLLIAVLLLSLSIAVSAAEEDDDEDSDSGFFEKIIEWFGSIGEKIDELLDFSKFFDALKERLSNTLFEWFTPVAGQKGLLKIISSGGREYASSDLDNIINKLFDAFYPLGVGIMLICFAYNVAHSSYTVDLNSSTSIVKPLVGMIVALIAFSLAKEIMTIAFTLSMQLTDKVISQSPGSLNDKLAQFDSINILDLSWFGYYFLNFITELVLLVNIAKIALMQATAPLYIGFAAADGSRRIMYNLIKEYGKCCLVPPITAAYVLITICIMNSTFGMVSSIVIGFSIFSMASKQLDKLIN